MATNQNTQTRMKFLTAQALGRVLVPDWYEDVTNPKVRAVLRKAMTKQIESSLGGNNLQALRALAVTRQMHG